MRWLLAVLLAASVGCRSSDEPAPKPAEFSCPPPSVRLSDEDRCTPIVACGAGFVADGRGGCDAILPKDPCPTATIAVPGDTSCVAVGVTACAKGFVADGSGGCEAVAPKSACAAGTMAIPGETTCREIASCGTGKWGDIPIESGKTLYVDGAYVGGGSDGTEARPFVTIQAAIDVAKSNEVVAIAEGSYAEDLRATSSVRLWGRCPSRVVVRGASPSGAALTTSASIEVHTLALTGAFHGILSTGGDLFVDRIWAHDLGQVGIFAMPSAMRTISIKGTLVERATAVGVVAIHAEATLDGTVVRDTAMDAGRYGDGVLVQQASTLAMRGSIVSGNTEFGVYVFGSNATIDASVVKDTKPLGGGTLGRGLEIESDDVNPAEVTVRGSVVAANHEIGVFVYGAKATIDSSVIRDTVAGSSTKKGGRGITVQSHPKTKRAGDLALQHSLVTDDHDVGVFVAGSKATLESSIVRRIHSNVADRSFGRAVEARVAPDTLLPSEVTIRRCEIAESTDAAIVASGSTLTVESSVVRDTAASEEDARGGEGIVVMSDPKTSLRGELTIRGTILLRHRSSGVHLAASKGTIEGTIVRDVAALADGQLGHCIDVDRGAELTMRGSLLDGCHDFGLLVFGGTASIADSVIARTSLAKSDGNFGDGVAVLGGAPAGAWTASSLSISGSLIDGNARAGMAVFGASLRVSNTLARCNAFDLDIEPLASADGSHPPEIDDGGGNACGCEKTKACKGSSAGLAAIDDAAPLAK